MYIHIVRGTSYTNLELLRVNRELHGAKVFPAKDIFVFILYSVDFFPAFLYCSFFFQIQMILQILKFSHLFSSEF